MVSGDKEAVSRALRDRSVTNWRTEGRNHQILLTMPDQAAVDQCVDDMRRNQVSVVQLNPRRITLEDAFLKLLDQSPAAEVALDAVEIIEDVVAIDED